MSGLKTSNKKPKPVAEVVYLLHGAKLTDPKWDQGLLAILFGVTSSHAGALLRFSDKDLFDKYVKNSQLEYSISEENGQTVYSVDLNFGPDGAVGLGDTKINGILYSQLEACLSTLFLSPVLLTAKGRALLGEKNTVKSKIFPKKTTFDIGITSAVHNGMIPQKFRDKNDLATINLALKQFGDDLEAAEAKHIKKPQYDVLMKEVNAAIEKLRLKLDPSMPPAQFKGEMDKFITIGTPPEETITIPLYMDKSNPNTLPLESMLQFAVDKRNAAPYNLILNNCAHYLRKMFMHAAKDNPKLKKVFETGFLSEENILGWVASVVSPHGDASMYDPPDLCTPVTMGRMVLALQHELKKLEENDKDSTLDDKFRNLQSKPEGLLKRRRIPDENDNPNKDARLTPRYILGISTSSHNRQSLGQHKPEINIVKIANQVCKQLNAEIGERAFEVTQKDGKIFILDSEDHPLIAIEKYAEQISVICYDETTHLDEFLAKAIHQQLKINNGEELNFNIVTNQDIPEHEDILSAIRSEYLDSKQVHISKILQRM